VLVRIPDFPGRLKLSKLLKIVTFRFEDEFSGKGNCQKLVLYKRALFKIFELDSRSSNISFKKVILWNKAYYFFLGTLLIFYNLTIN
jgi:hypothetical protein